MKVDIISLIQIVYLYSYLLNYLKIFIFQIKSLPTKINQNNPVQDPLAVLHLNNQL